MNVEMLELNAVSETVKSEETAELLALSFDDLDLIGGGLRSASSAERHSSGRSSGLTARVIPNSRVSHSRYAKGSPEPRQIFRNYHGADGRRFFGLRVPKPSDPALASYPLPSG